MMNDRLKFRAWVKDVDLSDEDGNEYKKSFMIYDVAIFGGCRVGHYGEDFERQLKLQGFSEDEIEQFENDWCSEDGDDWFNFDADEIEQCTCLKDKNEKPVFEGDLVKVDGLNEVFVVVYEENFCGFFSGFVLRRIDTFDSVTPSFVADSRVIGNIHENPEFKK